MVLVCTINRVCLFRRREVLLLFFFFVIIILFCVPFTYAKPKSFFSEQLHKSVYILNLYVFHQTTTRHEFYGHTLFSFQLHC